MKKLYFLLILCFFVSGCAGTNWNAVADALGDMRRTHRQSQRGTVYYPQPDIRDGNILYPQPMKVVHPDGSVTYQ